MKINDNVTYATLPRELQGRRNRAILPNAKDQARFKSEKTRRDDDVSAACPCLPLM